MRDRPIPRVVRAPARSMRRPDDPVVEPRPNFWEAMVEAMAQLTGPWPEVMALQDYEVLLVRSEVAGLPIPSRRDLAARWRCSSHQARWVIERVQQVLGLGEQAENASYSPATRQPIASYSPRKRPYQ